MSRDHAMAQVVETLRGLTQGHVFDCDLSPSALPTFRDLVWRLAESGMRIRLYRHHHFGTGYTIA